MLLIYLALTVLITTILCELAAKREWLPYWVSRKILHIVAVGACAVAGYYADSLGHRELLIWIVAGAEVLLLGLIGFGGLMREESGRRPWGIVWFPLAFLVLLIFANHEQAIGFCMAVLAFCDPAATICGKLFTLTASRKNNEETLDDSLINSNKPKPLWGTTPYSLTGDPKTIIGSSAFLISFVLLCYLFPIAYPPFLTSAPLSNEYYFHPTFYGLPTVLMLGAILALTEALGSKGIDNLLVPISSWIFIDSGIVHFDGFILSLNLIASIVFSYLTIRRRSLSAGGAVTASLLGILVVLSAGPAWLLPLFLFFGSSSLIGKVLPSKSEAGDAKQKQPRDATQVLANGAVYAAIAIFGYQNWDNGLLYFMRVPWEYYLLVAAAVATADTWSSEIGQYFQRPTWDLVKWRRVPAGLSGGVSWPGTLAGLAGATLIALSGFFLLPDYLMDKIPVIIGLGFGGMLIDSILGSLLQATYRDPATGALSDVCPPNGQLASGFRWMSNDLVNFLAILITVAIVKIPPMFW